MLYMIDKIKQLLYVGKNLPNKRICMFKNSRGKKQGNNTTWQEREREREKVEKVEDRRKKNSGRVGYSRSRIARAHYSLDRRGPRNAGIEFRLIDRAAIKRQSQGRAINKRGLVNIVKRLGAGHGFRGNVDTLFPPSEMDDGNRIIKNGAVHFSNFSLPLPPLSFILPSSLGEDSHSSPLWHTPVLDASLASVIFSRRHAILLFVVASRFLLLSSFLICKRESFVDNARLETWIFSSCLDR